MPAQVEDSAFDDRRVQSNDCYALLFLFPLGSLDAG